MRREAPKDVPCSQRLAQHLPLAGLEAIVPPHSPGERLSGASARQDVPPAAWGSQVPAVSSGGSLQIGLALDSCAPQHRTTQPGEALL